MINGAKKWNILFCAVLIFNLILVRGINYLDKRIFDWSLDSNYYWGFSIWTRYIAILVLSVAVLVNVGWRFRNKLMRKICSLVLFISHFLFLFLGPCLIFFSFVKFHYYRPVPQQIVSAIFWIEIVVLWCLWLSTFRHIQSENDNNALTPKKSSKN